MEKIVGRFLVVLYKEKYHDRQELSHNMIFSRLKTSLRQKGKFPKKGIPIHIRVQLLLLK